MSTKKVHTNSILMIDDELDIALIIKPFLEDYGFHVMQKTNYNIFSYFLKMRRKRNVRSDNDG